MANAVWIALFFLNLKFNIFEPPNLGGFFILNLVELIDNLFNVPDIL